MKYIKQKVILSIVFNLMLFRFFITQKRASKETALSVYSAFFATVYYKELDKMNTKNVVHNLILLQKTTTAVRECSVEIDNLTNSQTVVVCKIFKYEILPLMKQYILGKVKLSQLNKVLSYNLLSNESVYRYQLLELGVSESTLGYISEYLNLTLQYLRYTVSVPTLKYLFIEFTNIVNKFSKAFNLMA